MKISFIFILIALANLSMASNIQWSQPILYTDNGQSFAILNISWDHAWKNQSNHDAVWLFFKFLQGQKGYKHVKIASEGHEWILSHNESATPIKIKTSEDQNGVFLSSNSNFRGNVHATIKIALEPSGLKGIDTRNSRFTAFAIEMVNIPDGDFYVGDIDTSTTAFGSLFLADRDGRSAGLFHITSEDQEIRISPQAGDLYYQAKEGYEGDQSGTLPAEFPKGVKGFYVMKYEPTQGEYVRFLNSLSESQSQHRANFGGKNYDSERGSISISDGIYVCDHPAAPCNFMSWDDAMAFADWACLRPMTELEFTKAARGSARPTEGKDFPWGTHSKMQLQRMVGENGCLTMLNNWDESRLDSSTKAIFGASHYWVMDLAGSLWERVITIGDEKGRCFKGSEGDGRLTGYGFATNEDWPKGIEETGGFGFRGGGFYGYGRDYHDFNPYSPVSFRPYGGWSGGNRKNAYGARFVKRGS